MKVITDGNNLECLGLLLEFLAAWEKRPVNLTQMAYQWCSTISELRQTLSDPHPFEGGFSEVGPNHDQIHLGDTCHPTLWASVRDNQTLYRMLEIAFRLAVPDYRQPHLSLSHTAHCDWMFETAFSSYDDDNIADAVCAWIVDHHHVPTGSFVHHLAKRMESGKPFSHRLRRLCIHIMEHAWPRELRASELETVHLLNHLKVDVDDLDRRDDTRDEWSRLLLSVIYLPTGRESLSSHYWHLLYKLQSPYTTGHHLHIEGRSTPYSTITKFLEEAKDWDKLEAWMLVTWCRLQDEDPIEEGIEQITLQLLLQRPSALPRFKYLFEDLWIDKGEELHHIYMQARTEQSSLGSLPLYVPVYPTQPLFVLTNFLLLCHFSQEYYANVSFLQSFMAFTAGQRPKSHFTVFLGD